jgi:4-amino-4-deoxy-L-arabinose transferase-like glycosyltransferase
MRSQMLLAALAAMMFFTNLGATHLWDVDEAIFSQTAKEMLQRGDLVVPYFNGQVFPHKPALMYWMMISAYELFGPTEFAARFWSAIFGVGSVLLTCRLGRLLFSPSVGFWSGLILASTLNFNVIARAATPDSYLVFFSTLAMLIFAWSTAEAKSPDSNQTTWTGQTSFEPSWVNYALIYAAMGCGMLTKGPVGVVLPTAVIGLFLLIIRAEPIQRSSDTTWRGAVGNLLRFAGRIFSAGHFLRTVWSMRPLTALAVVAAVAAPWYVWVGIRTDGQWLSEFFGVQNLGRFLNAMDNHRGPIFYYLGALAVGFFPWSVVSLATLLHMQKQIHLARPWRPGYVLLGSWFAVWVGFFSLAGTKLPSYVVPAYPALALATGCLVDDWLREPSRVSRVWMRWAWGILALVGVGMAVALPIVGRIYLHGDWVLGLAGLVPLAGAAIGLVLSERGQTRAAVGTLSTLAVVLAIGLFALGAVRVDRHQDSPRFAKVIAQNTPADQQPFIATFHYFRPSQVFYTQAPVEEFESTRQIQTFFGEHPGSAFVLTTREEFERLSSILPPDVTVLESRSRFLHSGKVLLLGRANPSAVAAAKSDSKAGLSRH